jgi:hypothetical protein
MKIVTEVRHLDEVKGNFSISDQAVYQATVEGNFLIRREVSPSMLSSRLVHNSQEAKQSTQSIFSTVRAFVDQQQYFFEMLWRKAIPAKQRIKIPGRNLCYIDDNAFLAVAVIAVLVTAVPAADFAQDNYVARSFLHLMVSFYQSSQ